MRDTGIVSAHSFTRAPRRPVELLPSERVEMLARVRADPRFRGMPARARYCLLVALENIADGHGRWWWKVDTWAEQTGYSSSTVKRAIADMTEAKLVTREPYLRPDGLQGATTYVLDPRLVAHLPDLQGGSA